MKINEKTTTEREVRYFCADMVPRYWEDGEVNGEGDISWDEQQTGAKPRMPLAIPNNDSRGHKDETWKWFIKIDLDNGTVLGWPEGVEAKIYYKVCDQGVYWLEDEEGNEYHKIESYVPRFLDFSHEYDGDYAIFNINGDGKIEKWYEPNILEDKIESFLKTKGF